VDGTKCGVAFDAQIVARLPAETHDIRMNVILTPTRWLAVSQSVPAQP
jgi:5-formyltetrahydrofolate cyclo-ligase